jgi:hypothetical protein
LQAAAPLSEAGRDCNSTHTAVAAGHLGCLRLQLLADLDAANGLNAARQSVLHVLDHSGGSNHCCTIIGELVQAMSWPALAAIASAVDVEGQTPLQRTVWQQPAAVNTSAATTAAATAATAAGTVTAVAAAHTQHVCIACASWLISEEAAGNSDELCTTMLELALADVRDDSVQQCASFTEQLCRESSALDVDKCLYDAVLHLQQPSSNAAARVRVLLHCGAAAHQYDKDDCSLLHVIARGPAHSHYTAEQLVVCKQVMQLLVADTSTVTSMAMDTGDMPLHLAYDYPELIEALIEAGCEVNFANNGGQTPLVSIVAVYC